MNDFDEEQLGDDETLAASDEAPAQETTAAPRTEGETDAERGASSESADSGKPTTEQKREIARWINEGVGLSDVQKRLADDFGLTMTYMEVRFLVDDLDLDLLDEEEDEVEADDEEDAADSTEETPEAEDDAGVSVSVDKVTRPGVMASGVATFSDGVECPWYLDQYGRLGLMPKNEGYKPPEEDLQDFQQKLDDELRRSGM